MDRWGHTKRAIILSSAVALWLSAPLVVWAENATVTTDVVHVKGTWAEEEAKLNSQQVQIITKKDIEKKQAKSVEDIIFTQTGVSRTVDAMGRVGVSIRGAEARHTLILVDGQPVLGDFDKYSGAADEVQRLGTENVERIEVIQGAASAKYGSDAIGGVVNIITKKAQKKPTLQLNAEGMRRKSDGDTFPFQNFFIRADSGQMGKLKVGLSGSKRDLMPVLASVKRRDSGMAFDDKSCQIGNNTTTYCQNTAVAAIAFFQHRILDHRLCLACLTFFSCRERENIGLISGIQQFLFQWTCIQRFHIAVCDNRKFMKFSNQTVCQIRYDEIQKSMSDLNLIGIIHYFF